MKLKVEIVIEAENSCRNWESEVNLKIQIKIGIFKSKLENSDWENCTRVKIRIVIANSEWSFEAQTEIGGYRLKRKIHMEIENLDFNWIWN